MPQLRFFLYLALLAVCLARPGLAELADAIRDGRSRVAELAFIAKVAKEKNVRVYLFGGAAATFAHYVKRDSGNSDYDFEHIFRSNQDIDLVVDGTPEQTAGIAEAIRREFPYQLAGSSKSTWDVRPLRAGIDDKEPLLGNRDFLDQHLDSHSTGLVDLTDGSVRDLRAWDAAKPPFLESVEEGKLTYYYSERHHETSRAKEGLNPPILSAIRALYNASRFGLKLSPADRKRINAIVKDWNPSTLADGGYVQSWIASNAPKILLNAANLEESVKLLRSTKLDRKLAALAPIVTREPLKSFRVGRGKGRTAEQMKLDVVSHQFGRNVETPFLIYEAITGSVDGKPNAFISRKSVPGESADYGDGFYVSADRKGVPHWSFGDYTILFRLDPSAREGADFTFHKMGVGDNNEGDQLVILNRNALSVIPMTATMDPLGFFKLLAESPEKWKKERATMDRFYRRWLRDFKTLPSGMKTALEAVLLGQIKKKAWNRALFEEWFGSRFAAELPEVAAAFRAEVLKRPLESSRQDIHFAALLPVWGEAPGDARRLVAKLVDSEESHTFVSEKVFKQPWTRPLEDLMIRLLEKAGKNESDTIGGHPVHNLPLFAFSEPHTREMTSALDKLLAFGDEFTTYYLLSNTFSKEHSKGWETQLLEVGRRAVQPNNYGLPLVRTLETSVLSQPWATGKCYDALRALIAR